MLADIVKKILYGTNVPRLSLSQEERLIARVNFSLREIEPIIRLFKILFHFFLFAIILTLILNFAGIAGAASTKSLFFLWELLSSYFLPIMILILSLLVVLLSNPIYALVSLIIVFFGTALFLLSINVNFLAMIYLIIYIGAIAILFLFVIMMFNLRQLEQQNKGVNDFTSRGISFSLYFFVLSKFYAWMRDIILTFVEYDKYFNDFATTHFDSIRHFLTYQHTDTLLFGTLLYDYYSYLFLLSGLLLLTSMLGSIVLALSTTE